MTGRDRARKVLEYPHQDLLIYEIEQAIIAAIEEEREACAKIADEVHSNCSIACCERKYTADSIACQIRARSDLDETNLS